MSRMGTLGKEEGGNRLGGERQNVTFSLVYGV